MQKRSAIGATFVMAAISSGLCIGANFSTVSRENAARVSDYYFMNGNSLKSFQSQVADVKQRSPGEGLVEAVKFALNRFVIAHESEEEAVRVLQQIQGKANTEAVEAFGAAVKNTDASTANKTGMWADFKFEDLVQYNDGFRTKLIGTHEKLQIGFYCSKASGLTSS